MKKVEKAKKKLQEIQTNLNNAKAELSKAEMKSRVFWICYFGIPCIVAFMALASIAFISSWSGDGEPLTFLDGISIWPTELIRLFSGFLAIYFLLQSIKTLNCNNEEIKQYLNFETGEKNLTDKAKKSFLVIKGYWNNYCEKHVKNAIYILTGIFTIVYFFAGNFFLSYCGRPSVPFRGDLSNYTDKCILFFSLLSMLFLTWFVIHSIRYCRKFFSDIIDSKTSLQLSNMLNIKCSIDIDCREGEKACLDKLTKCLSEYGKHLTDNILVQWFKINVIAKRTEVIGKMITYPFIVFTLLLIARNKFFDHWTWPISLVIVISLIIFIALYYSIVLFHDANVARKKTITHLYEERFKLMNTQIPTKFDAANDRITEFIKQKTLYIDDIIKDLRNLKSGAFAPLSNSPVLIAILAPLGGLGSIAILQHLPQLFNK